MSEIPKPQSVESNTARSDGSYFAIARSYVDAGVCVFCHPEETGQFPITQSKDGRAWLYLNKFPRSNLDLLAVTSRHVEAIDQLTREEVWALHEVKLLGRQLIREMLGRDLFFLNRDGGDKTVPHYHDHILSYWPGLITWKLEEGRGDNLDIRAQMLKEAVEQLRGK